MTTEVFLSGLLFSLHQQYFNRFGMQVSVKNVLPLLMLFAFVGVLLRVSSLPHRPTSSAALEIIHIHINSTSVVSPSNHHFTPSLDHPGNGHKFTRDNNPNTHLTIAPPSDYNNDGGTSDTIDDDSMPTQHSSNTTDGHDMNRRPPLRFGRGGNAYLHNVYLTCADKAQSILRCEDRVVLSVL